MIIQNARRKIDEKLRDQRRQLRRERAKEEYLNNKKMEMQRHNELMKIQKEIERQHREKNKDLDMQMAILNQRMELHRRQARKTIAVKDVSRKTEVLLTDYTKNMGMNLNGNQDVYDVSQLENLIPEMDGVVSENDDDYKDDDQVDGFWDRMKKIESDMQDFKERISVIRNL